MNMTGNTILITGGNSGIGRGLAEAFHALGNKVIITGRRQEKLKEVANAHPGISTKVLDVQDADAVRRFSKEIIEEFPELNILINNAGIASIENLREGDAVLDSAEAIIATNILAPVRLTAALLPHLLKQAHATIVNVGSGLAHVPLAIFPTYSASKAMVHSYTQSLRHQLAGTSVEVLELIPPAVQTGLGGLDPDREPTPHVMPLAQYIAESMELFQQQPTPHEICVKNVHFLRFAESNGSYEKVYGTLNPASSTN